jgi:hypothetical protein
MSEAVRFYWPGGEANLPLDALPEGDRSPLRVRRSVVQARAPEALRQLGAGRFVAAAWEAGGVVSMILCHPNLGRGAVDAVLVNAPALPRVVLRPGSWGEVPELSRLFLRAFGSEAASIEECAGARRDLVNWLAEHGQPQMAAVVRHFQAFPFGLRSGALEVIDLWRHVLVKGPKEQLDRFLDEVGRRFEALGWARETSLEGRLNGDPHQANRFYCWVSAHENRPHVRLCLNRVTERRLRGGTYDLLDGRAGVADLAAEMQHVLAEVLEPAAAAVGLEVAYPRLGPISRVEPRTAAALTALAGAGDGQWPLPEHLEPLWEQVVRNAYREGVAINPEELTAWFAASGWEGEAAAELAERFYRGVARLSEYEEAGRQPA